MEAGESFKQATVGELLEETGFAVSSVGTEIGRREAILLLPTGEQVVSEERYFLVKGPHCNVSTIGRTREERDVTVGHCWWTLDDLQNSPDLMACPRNHRRNRVAV